MENFEKFQALAVVTHLINVVEGMGKVEASEDAAESVYVSEFYNKKKVEESYKSRLIRVWADLFLKTGMYTKHTFLNIITFLHT
jgi:hypothetical protein